MPDQSAHLSDFRLGGHKLFCHLSVYVGRLVYETTLAFVAPEPVKVLIVNSAEPTWDSTDIRSGFRVDIYSSSGAFKGRTRVRYGNTLTDTAIHVREISLSAIKLEVGDIVRVYRDLRLSDRLVEANELFSPDGTPYSDQGSNPPPLPTSGGAWAGWSRMLPCLGTGSDSALVDPDSATPVTHLWDGDGLTVDNDTAEDVELTGTWGEYLVEHTVTDPDNGKSITQYVPVVIHDADHPPFEVQIEDLPDDETRGGSARVRMLDSSGLDFASIPDGSLVILWKEEFIAGVRQSFGARSPGRSHILFVGYLRREEGAFESEDGVESLTFEVISPLSRLEELMGYGKVMIREASPDQWNELKALTVKRGAIQIPMFYSNLLECFDLVFRPTFVDYDYSGFYLEQGSPLSQMRELAKGADSRLVEDRRGRFEIQLIPERSAFADRAIDWAVTLILAKRDVKSWRYSREHWLPLNRLECRGFIAGASTNDPIFSEYYGLAPGLGNQQSVEEKLIATDQANLNNRCGRIGASLNGEYVDDDGTRQMALDLEIVLRGLYDVFDFYDEFIELDFQSEKRGIDFSLQQYRLVSASIDFSGGTCETTLRLRTVTHGLAGATVTYPEEDTPPYTPPDYGTNPQPPPELVIRVPAYTSDQLPTEIVSLASASAQFGYATSWNPITGGPSWVENSTGLGAGYGIWLEADRWNYDRYFAAMSDALYRNNDPKGGSSWASVADNAALWGNSGRLTKNIEGSINRKGYFGLSTGTNTFGYTIDYFSTFNVVSITGAANNYGTAIAENAQCVFALSPWNSSGDGRIFALVFVGPFFHWQLYRSDDWGATWAVVGSPIDLNTPKCVTLTVPYKRPGGANNINDSSQVLFAAGGDGHPTNGGRFYISTSAGASWTNRPNMQGIMVTAGAFVGRAMQSFTHDSNHVVCPTNRIGAGGVSAGLVISEDAGVNAVASSELYTAANKYVFANGHPLHSTFWLIWCRASPSTSDKIIEWTDNDGTTWHSFNPPSFFTGDQFCANVQADISSSIPAA